MSRLECYQKHVSINSCKRRGDVYWDFKSTEVAVQHKPDMESPKLNGAFHFLILISKKPGVKHAKNPNNQSVNFLILIASLIALNIFAILALLV